MITGIHSVCSIEQLNVQIIECSGILANRPTLEEGKKAQRAVQKSNIYHINQLYSKITDIRLTSAQYDSSSS